MLLRGRYVIDEAIELRILYSEIVEPVSALQVLPHLFSIRILLRLALRLRNVLVDVYVVQRQLFLQAADCQVILPFLSELD
jgi:hypothetical protein